MEFLNDIIARLPALISDAQLIPTLLLIGAGTSIFLIADNGAQGFSFFNGLFVIFGYLARAAITLIGLYLLWQLLAPETVPALPTSTESGG